jgi:biotin carboxylase
MSQHRPVTFLCLASHFKGGPFLEAARQLGCHVILLTREKLAEKEWPWDSIDERFFMPDINKQPDVTHAVAYLMRSRHIDRIIPLDDYDVPTAAALREHLRLPGMGDTTTRHFRDKLAMRVQARATAILVPEFVHVLNYDNLREFMLRVTPPWVLKPRTEAGAMGIKKAHSENEVWHWLEVFGDQQSNYVMEQFVAGEVYHVDSIISEGEVIFAEPHKYWRPPMSVAHEGGVFISRTLPRGSEEAQAIVSLNQELMTAFGMVRGVSHTEFIRAYADGRFYFLETAARVGGANISDMVEAATAIDLWREWARIELAHVRGEAYQLPEPRQHYAGVMICLAKQEQPDLSHYDDPEVVLRLPKHYHAGLILAAPEPERIDQLLDAYSHRFDHDFLAVAPPLDRPPDDA